MATRTNGGDEYGGLTGAYTYNLGDSDEIANPDKATTGLFWSLKLGNYTTGKSSVALADNGEIDMDRFAKLVYMATRTDGNSEYGGGAGAWTYTLTDGDEIANPDEATTGLSAAMVALEGKVDAQFVTAAGGSAELKLENVVVTRNDLDAADVSTAYQTLVDGVTAAEAKGLLEDHARTLRLHTNHGLYVDGSENPVQSAKLQLNGHDRFSAQDGHYFNYVQPYQHFSNTPSDGNNVYSFALNPEEHQPSGTCNMSRIDNATLSLTLGERTAASSNNFANQYLVDDTVCSIYTVNYNVLRIMSGMGGLAYSN